VTHRDRVKTRLWMAWRRIGGAKENARTALAPGVR